MNWKKFKTAYTSENAEARIDETHFILGLDLGNATSAMAFYDVSHGMPEVIDISGGYGRPTVPTVMQYICDTKEWVFGEYAVLNRGEYKDIYLSSLIDKLGNKEYIEIDNRPVSVVGILSMYLKELLGNIKNINPKAEIVGIVTAVSSYLSENAKEELLLAFKGAGYDKELIEFVSDRECVFARHYFDKTVQAEQVLLLDFGSREFRGGLYKITPDRNGSIKILSQNSMFDKELGTDRTEEAVVKMVTQMYCANMDTSPSRLSPKVRMQLAAFAYQHKDLLFQKGILSKPVRMCFTFAYPPFQQTVTKAEADELVAPLKREFTKFIQKILGEDLGNLTRVSPESIGTVICVGGGFEMLWARSIVERDFPMANVVFYKNAKCAIAEGAAVLAAAKLGVIDEKQFMVEDKNQITKDIGIKVMKDKKEKFVPLIEKNSFWWQAHLPKLFLINEKTDKPVQIGLYEREADGELKTLGSLKLADLPERPRGTTRVKILPKYNRYNEIEITVVDCGFGEFYPATGYEERFVFRA